MKKVFAVLAVVLLATSMFAQSPEKINYQAVIRNTSDNLVTNSVVGMQMSILQGSTDGTAVYVERQFPATNANGLVSVEVGTGTIISGNFTLIDWSNGPYFIKTETDLNGGANYTITGTSQLLSVPYALHARTAETIIGGITETDPAYTASEAINITATDITNLSNLSGTNTGDQDISGITINMQAIKDTAAQIRANIPNMSGLLTSETDPVFTVWDKNYNDLTNKPALFNGQYSNLIGTPALSTVATSGSYDDLTNKPNIKDSVTTYAFNGNYNDLTNKPHAISDFTMNANLQNITNLANPTNTQDAATKAYVDKLETKVRAMENMLINAGLYTVTDMDNNTYNVVKIGTQIWMAENLKTTKYNDGTIIPLVTDSTEWVNLTTPGYCWYNNDSTSYAQTYGVLYNWYTVNRGNLCPTNWHVPTETEWTTLIDFLDGESIAGGKLKETGTTYWYSPNVGATNETGFTALPGGNRFNGTFNHIGYFGEWWSATENYITTAYYLYIHNNFSYAYKQYNNKKNGFSVRCIRD